jgi:hypothetical protein
MWFPKHITSFLNITSDQMSVGAIYMANGGLTFLLLTFQYLVGWRFIKLVFSVNLFRLVRFESWSRGSLAAIR